MELLPSTHHHCTHHQKKALTITIHHKHQIPKKALHRSPSPLTKPTSSNPPPPLTKPRKTHTQADKQSVNSTPKLKPFNTKTPNSNHQNKHRFKQTNKHNHQFNIDSNKHQ